MSVTFPNPNSNSWLYGRGYPPPNQVYFGATDTKFSVDDNGIQDNYNNYGPGDRNSKDSGQKYAAMKPLIDKLAKETGVPPELLAAIMLQESRGYSVNEMGGLGGLTQCGLAEFNEMKEKYPEAFAGLDPMSPEGQLTATAYRLKEFYEKYGSWDEAAARYNGGEFAGGHLNDPNYLNGIHMWEELILSGKPLPS